MQNSDSRHISLIANADPATIYGIARDLQQLPTWASGLAAGELEVIDDNTVELDSPMGRVQAQFVPRNELGILDHTVTLPDGTEVLNPLRVIAHPEGSELIFSIRRGEAEEEKFEADCYTVRTDLERLTALVESPE